MKSLDMDEIDHKLLASISLRGLRDCETLVGDRKTQYKNLVNSDFSCWPPEYKSRAFDMYYKIPEEARQSNECIKKFLETHDGGHKLAYSKGGSADTDNIIWENKLHNRTGDVTADKRGKEASRISARSIYDARKIAKEYGYGIKYREGLPHPENKSKNKSKVFPKASRINKYEEEKRIEQAAREQLKISKDKELRVKEQAAQERLRIVEEKRLQKALAEGFNSYEEYEFNKREKIRLQREAEEEQRIIDYVRKQDPIGTFFCDIFGQKYKPTESQRKAYYEERAWKPRLDANGDVKTQFTEEDKNRVYHRELWNLSNDEIIEHYESADYESRDAYEEHATSQVGWYSCDGGAVTDGAYWEIPATERYADWESVKATGDDWEIKSWIENGGSID